jgi:hypothetical protein
MSRIRKHDTGDEGVALVFALVFLTVVGLLVAVALTQSQTTSITGSQAIGTTKVEYALDAGIERAIEVLKADQASLGSSPLCPDAATGQKDITSVQDGSGLDVNDQSVHYTCETLGGAARDDSSPTSNFGIVILDNTADALSTYGPGGGFPAGVQCNTPSAPSPPGGYFWIGGAVFLSGPQSSLAPPLLICEGDVNQMRAAGCTRTTIDTALATLKPGTPGHLRACTDETQLQAAPAYAPPPTPAYDVSNCHVDLNSSGIVRESSCSPPGGSGPTACRIFYPGHYASEPPLLGGSSNANYFASGRYYFDGIGNFIIGASTTVVAGRDDGTNLGTQVAGTACAGALLGNDVVATADAPLVPGAPAGTTAAANIDSAGGSQWILGGSSQIDVEGTLTVNSGPLLAGGLKPYTLVTGVGPSGPRATPAYSAWAAGSGSETVSGATCNASFALCNGSGSGTSINGRLYAPTASVKLLSTNPTVGVFTGGIVVNRLRLGGPAGDIAVGSPGGIPETAHSYRTIRVRSSGSSSGLTDTAVITLSNFAPYTVEVLGWKTDQ